MKCENLQKSYGKANIHQKQAEKKSSIRSVTSSGVRSVNGSANKMRCRSCELEKNVMHFARVSVYLYVYKCECRKTEARFALLLKRVA